MFMRVTRGRVKPGCWDDYEQAYSRHVEGRPAPPGLLGRWLMRSLVDGDLAFSISLWESQETMEAYERSDAVRREILPHLAPFIGNEFVAHHCGIKVQARRDPP